MASSKVQSVLPAIAGLPIAQRINLSSKVISNSPSESAAEVTKEGDSVEILLAGAADVGGLVGVGSSILASIVATARGVDITSTEVALEQPRTATSKTIPIDPVINTDNFIFIRLVCNYLPVTVNHYTTAFL